jgi:PAS domain S-box-containing protein
MSSMPKSLFDPLAWHFPAEWVTAALTLNLVSIGVVVGLFVYLNQQTKLERFGLWTASWMFYAIHLAALIGLQGAPATLWLVIGERASIGVSALLMFWGSLQLTHKPRSHRELVAGIVFVVLWSGVAAHQIGQSRWVVVPVFALLAIANAYTGIIYLRLPNRHRSARLLGVGFSLWAAHLLAFPFLDWSAPTMTTAHLASAALALFIALGMLVEQEQLVSEQDYRALFESADDALLLVDCHTHAILEANRAASQLAGRDGATLPGRQVWELFPHLRERLTGNAEADNIAAEINRAGQLAWQRTDGSRLTCEVRAVVARCPRGPVLQVNVRDVTVQQQTAAELHVKSAALEVASNCILLSDREGRILWVNPAFTAMTGYTLAEAVGEKAWFLKSATPDDALLRELFTVLHGNDPWRGEVVNRRKDGSEYRERLTITPVRNTQGVLTNFVTLKEDLTPPPAGTLTAGG